MNNNLHIRIALPEDAFQLAPNLREADKQEVITSTGKDPLKVIQESLEISSEAYSIVSPEGQVIGIFGLCAVPDGSLGIPWLLASPEILKHRRHFLSECRGWIERFQDKHNVLANCVDARNTISIRWLEWCGFQKVQTHQSWGLSNLPFHEYAKVRAHV
ncbi:hypothetical protein [Aestuariispira insulae]|uniref:N-acetyltransferase domain-containing protein n=1 Tax=Aestuariispira insulae TaxID=1461337 RepID=A0A3D9HVM9_9PROT|nr:hypothetical protein [Aestuariispira insulae]RED53490.1 hypothetical protein DFP90_101279 [Aestuariispira insulae]